ncbi:MAG: phosphatidate cytidylyltransferase [Fidelibacterota bacterium]
MTKKRTDRTLVNLLGIPGILFILWLGGLYFALFVTVVMILSLNEFYSINRPRNIHPLYAIGWIAVLLSASYYYFAPELTNIQLIGVLMTLVLGVLAVETFRRKPNSTYNIAITVLGILYIPILLGALIGLRQYDTAHQTRFTLSLIIAIWTCDSAAMFFGKLWGKKKALEAVSPNKTVVGAVAGLITAMLIFLLFQQFNWIGTRITYTDVIALGIVAGIFGQLGDFAESKFKRDLGLKDTSNFLRGHGGVLDRFDSLIFASPLAYLYLTIFY